MNPIILDHFGRKTKLIELLRSRGARIGAEIGTDHGKYAQQLLEGIPDLTLHCVDPWLPYTEGLITHDKIEMEQIYQEAFSRIAPLGGHMIKETSNTASNYFNPNSLDFVFIDGNHDFSHVYEDLILWTKKVKPGGIVCGHDYKEDKINNYGVIEAVNIYVKENNIAPLFILHTGGTFVDCWMFIKQ